MTFQLMHAASYDLELDGSTLVNDGVIDVQAPLTIASLDNHVTVRASANLAIGQLAGLVSGQLSGGVLIGVDTATIQLPAEVRTLGALLELEGSARLVDPDGRPALRNLAQILPGAVLISGGPRLATSAQLENAGSVVVQAASVLEADRGYVQDGGQTRVADGARLLALGTGLKNRGGVLEVTNGAHLVGNVVNQAELRTGSSAQPAVIEGTLTEGRGGLLHFVVTSVGPLLEVTGPVQLAGTLSVEPGGPSSQEGDVSTLLTSPTITGTAKSPGLDFDVRFGVSSVTATRTLVVTEDSPAVFYGGWHTAPSTVAADGVMHESQTAGDTATATISFPLGWDGERWPDGGLADVLVNGAPHTVNTYGSTVSAFSDPFEFEGDATLAVTVNGTTPPGSTGSWVSIDGAHGLSTPVDDADFSYDGWSLVHDGANAYRVSSQAGVAATFGFDGSSVEWITQTGPDRGRANVLVDGVAHPTIDLYSRKRKNGVVESFSGLGPGHHTLQIVPLGTARRRSTGTGVVIDGFVARA
jgi:hypothetical protein